MASNVMTEGILTIAVVIAATAAGAVLIQSNYQLSSVQAASFQNAKEIASTSIKIVFATNVSSNEVKIWVKNNGLSDIPSGSISRFDIFFGPRANPAYIPYNGIMSGWNFTISNDADQDGYLDPGETLEIRLWANYDFAPGDYFLKVATNNGVSDTYQFSI